jgi:hypothetical protein
MAHAAVIAGGLFAVRGFQADDWPQWRGPKRDGVWRETEFSRRSPRKVCA